MGFPAHVAVHHYIVFEEMFLTMAATSTRRGRKTKSVKLPSSHLSLPVREEKLVTIFFRRSVPGGYKVVPS